MVHLLVSYIPSKKFNESSIIVLCLYVGVEIELDSEEGVIDVNEGVQSLNIFYTEGFSYGPIAITMSIFTYSEYEERGYDLADSFEADEIPANAANGLLF